MAANDHHGYLVWLLAGAFAVWVFAPDSVGFGTGDTVTSYSVRVKACGPNYCSFAILSPIVYRIDFVHNQIVWRNTETGDIGAHSACLIADKENWTCDAGSRSMKGGTIEQNSADLLSRDYYVSHAIWRLAWIGLDVSTFGLVEVKR